MAFVSDTTSGARTPARKRKKERRNENPEVQTPHQQSRRYPFSLSLFLASARSFPLSFAFFPSLFFPFFPSVFLLLSLLGTRLLSRHYWALPDLPLEENFLVPRDPYQDDHSKFLFFALFRSFREEAERKAWIKGRRRGQRVPGWVGSLASER